jgi:hypothetical protein
VYDTANGEGCMVGFEFPLKGIFGMDPNRGSEPTPEPPIYKLKLSFDVRDDRLKVRIS